jgi:hypothetical protein
MWAAKQPITAIAMEVVPEVNTEASLGTPQDLSPIASIDWVPTPEFCLVEETKEGLCIRGVKSSDPSLGGC